MNAKEYLSQAYRMDRKINSKIKQLTSLRESAMRATASIHAKRVSGTSQHSPMEDAIIKLIDLEHEINDDIDKLVDLKREIVIVIDAVKQPEYHLLLELRYLRYKRWEEIADVMNCSWHNLHYAHAKALMAIKLDNADEVRSGGACG